MAMLGICNGHKFTSFCNYSVLPSLNKMYYYYNYYNYINNLL